MVKQIGYLINDYRELLIPSLDRITNRNMLKIHVFKFENVIITFTDIGIVVR